MLKAQNEKLPIISSVGSKKRKVSLFVHMCVYVFADTERGQWKCQEGFPPRGRAADQPAAWAHRHVLRCLCGERPSHHGVWVHETRRPEQVPQARLSSWLHWVLPVWTHIIRLLKTMFSSSLSFKNSPQEKLNIATKHIWTFVTCSLVGLTDQMQFWWRKARPPDPWSWPSLKCSILPNR